jgi:hypothetical protein
VWLFYHSIVTSAHPLARYIVIPEEKGSNLVCISAIGATAGERFCIQHPSPSCPSTMAVDERRCSDNQSYFFLHNIFRSGAMIFALRQKIFVSGECPPFRRLSRCAFKASPASNNARIAPSFETAKTESAGGA